MFSSLKLKLWAGGLLIALVASSLVYVHIGSLTDQNKLLEAQNQSLEIVNESYAANAKIQQELHVKQQQILTTNRVARDKLIRENSAVINTLKGALDATDEECLGRTLPDSILNSLYGTETTN